MTKMNEIVFLFQTCLTMVRKLEFGPMAAIFQTLFLVLFAIFAKYDLAADGSNPANSERGKDGSNPRDNPINNYYPSKSKLLPFIISVYKCNLFIM